VKSSFTDLSSRAVECDSIFSFFLEDVVLFSRNYFSEVHNRISNIYIQGLKILFAFPEALDRE